MQSCLPHTNTPIRQHASTLTHQQVLGALPSLFQCLLSVFALSSSLPPGVMEWVHLLYNTFASPFFGSMDLQQKNTINKRMNNNLCYPFRFICMDTLVHSLLSRTCYPLRHAFVLARGQVLHGAPRMRPQHYAHQKPAP